MQGAEIDESAAEDSTVLDLAPDGDQVFVPAV
jgi:hypothetical protein